MAYVTIKISSKPHPVHTPRQVSEMTGRSESQICQMTNRLDEDEQTQLDHCWPFPTSDNSKHVKTGPRLIVGNKKLDKFLAFCKSKKLKNC